MKISNLKNIYVRTLKSMPERTEWAKKEMERVGIENYEFYYNIEKTDPIIDEWKDKGLIKLGPECFQCKKTVCSCRAKVVTKGIVANFMSCIFLWRDIVNNDDPDDSLYMILEDDIYFQDNAAPALNYIFQDGFLDNIPKEPVLFKMGWGDMLAYRGTHFEVPIGKHVFIENSDKFSNPCYVANKRFFRYLTDNFKEIHGACDMWVHREMCQGVKHFELFPAICKELSHVGMIKSAMHTKYSEATKMQNLYSTTKDPQYIDKFIEAERRYFDYWFKYAEEEWGITW